MASSARKTLRDAYKDTNAVVGRLVPTLFLTCISTVILGGTDDHVLLSGGEVSTPFVGKTRYEIFMVIAPLSIVVLRIYIELQLAHLRRMEEAVTRFKVKKPLTLNAGNHVLLLAAGAIALHVVPPLSIGFLGRHASATYPEYGLGLYTLSFLLTVWSAWSMLERGRRLRTALALTFPVAMTLLGGALLHNNLLSVGGVLGANTVCDQRFDGPLAGLATPFLRQINLEKRDFEKQNLKRKNLTCGDLTDSTWHEADLRESLLWGADLRGAEFNFANISQADFASAILRQAKLVNVIAFESQFYEADLENAKFENAELEETRFVLAKLEAADFRGATLGHAKLYKARLSDASFRRAKISDTDFVNAELYDAEFVSATLVNVDFLLAKLDGASFAGADLRDISFDEAELWCADFRAASFDNVDFREVDPEMLYEARFDTTVRVADTSEAPAILWPEGFDPAMAGSRFGPGSACEGE